MAQALLSTVFKISRRGQIGLLLIDARIAENHGRSAQVTDYEIEDGTVISDHIKLDPLTLSIQGFISDAPAEYLGIRSLGGASQGVIGSIFPNQALLNQANPEQEGTVPNGENRNPVDSWTYLHDVWRKRTPISVITSLQLYKNMVITSLSAPRSVEIGKSLEFNAELREVRIVRSATVTIPSFKVKKAAEDAASKNNAGNKTPMAEDQGSILYQRANDANDGFGAKIIRSASEFLSGLTGG